MIPDLPVSARTLDLLGRLPALTSLALRIDKADPKSLKLLATLRALTGLTLAGAGDLHELGNALSGLRLKSFGLIGLKGIDSAFLQTLQEMRGLEELQLYRVNLRDEQASELAQLSQLRSLRLERNQLTDNSLAALSKMHKLERVGLGGNRVTKDGVLKLASALPRCKIQWDGGVVGPTLPSEFKNTLGMEFVLVPKGKSWLGGGGGKPGNSEVEIQEDFYLGKYEVTQAEWRKVMGSHPSLHSRTGPLKDKLTTVDDSELDRFPVENVNWDDAQQFLEKLNLRDQVAGWVYRLPKEAEWEYACRGGPMKDRSESAFDFYLDKPSHKLLPTQANFDFGEKALKRTCKVGLYAPNRLGLYDMHGNVTELCDDEIRGYGRPVRGGAWKTVPVPCSKNVVFEKTSRSDMIGLRLARVPVGKEIVKGMAP